MEAEIERRLQEKGLSESSIRLYIRNLQKLSGDNPIKSLTFLKDVEEIEKKLSGYKPNTIRNYVISIVSVLGLDKDKRGKKKLYDTYASQLIQSNKTLREEAEKNEKSETQKENWLSWDEIEQKWNELKGKVEVFKSSKSITAGQYSQLLDFVVLSLYVLVPPRRNDYQQMMIVGKTPSDTSTNYVDLERKQFVFNKFKTAKREGQVVIPIPDALQSVLQIYLRFHPLYKNGKEPVAFLVGADGRPLTATNSITRILNRVFGKRVGSSLLRHSYLSSKYKDVRQEMKKDSEAMSHSVETQQTQYVKN
jgi:integrase